MALLPEDISVDLKAAIDELESAISEMESRLESTCIERDEAKVRQVELEIENSNLRRELSRARERQGSGTDETREQLTATANILKVIASSPFDAQPVFDTIVGSAAKLFEPCSATITTLKDGQLHWNATAASIPDIDADQARTIYPIPADRDRAPSMRAILERRIIEIPDISAPDTPELTRNAAAAGRFRSITFVPLVDQEQGIGTIIFTHPQAGFKFSDRQKALMQTFADQAVIAIQNTRQFNETRESLQRQTATANILKVIASSPSDVQPVFDTIAESARRICGGHTSSVTQVAGDSLRLMAFASESEAGTEEMLASFPTPLSSNGIHSRVARTGELAFRHDMENEPDLTPEMKETARARGYRSILVVPMMREGAAIGTIGVTRPEAGLFPDNFTELLCTFADQAVIAIENARLIRETKEALERQTATAEILKVIASSPSDVQPVFEAIASSAKRLLAGFTATVLHFRGDQLHLVAFTPTSPEADAGLQTSFPLPVNDFPIFGMVRDGGTIQFPDTEADGVPAMNRDLGRLRGFRSVLFVPLMNRSQAVGILSLTRTAPGAFADHHVQLLQTFADQAVIAIENTRLFNETKEALERQTATSNILRVIASSPSDAGPVFETIAENARRLCGGYTAIVTRLADARVHLAAASSSKGDIDAEALRASFPLPLSAEGIHGQVARSGELAFRYDIENEPDVTPRLREAARARGYRSILVVPMMRDGVVIGTIGVTRQEPGLFNDNFIKLLRTFADQAVIAVENARLIRETQETLERQTATADILKVIASSPSDVQPVFEAIASSAKRLLGGFSATVYRFINGQAHLEALTPTTPEADAILTSTFPRPVADFAPFRMTQTGEVMRVSDTEDPSYEFRDIARARGYRSMLFAPLMNKGASIGFIAVTRVEPGTFSDHHVQLLQTFADQAVIAIENTRLFNETKEALERQTATADILKVIASSPSDVQPVFDAIVHSANRLIGGFSTAAFRYRDGKIHLAAFTPADAAGDAVLQSSFPIPLEAFPPYSLTREGAPAELQDTETEPAARDIARARGYRSMLFAPLMNEGEAVGIITVTRPAPGPFGEQHTRLLQMFADQAVIAIKNVGLFNEVQARTEELSESLQQQTAVGDVLKTISRTTFDLQPVLDTLVNTAAILCNADMAFIMRRAGEEYRAGAAVGYSEAYIDFLTNHPLAVNRGTVTGRAVLERRPVQILDVMADPEYTLHETYKLAGQRTTLGVPLLRENEPIGTIVLARTRVEAFTQKQIDLVATFADQAVIAIENVRLFDQLRQRTEDLSEALRQQTTTADVLKVISRSAFDLQTVLDTLTESAARLCGADMGAIARKDERGFYHATNYNFPVDWVKVSDVHRLQAGNTSVVGKVLLANAAVQIPDVLADADYGYSDMQQAAGYRTVLGVPLLRSGEPVGVLFLGRKNIEPFTEKQIELVATFADQAVIAIENVRLFDEVQAKTRDLSEALTYQTGSANILRVIASSPTDINPVLTAIVDSASELCGAYDALVRLRDGDSLAFSAHHGPIPTTLMNHPINRSWTAGVAMLDQKPVHIHDLLSAEGDAFPETQERARQFGHRTILSVPLLREGVSIGVIVLRRIEVNPFTDKQIALLQTFADQAVIALGNVRLFEEVQAKTRDLTEALTYQTGSANILKVTASSPTDVAPVLNAIVESACELCDANDAVVFLKDGDRLRQGAHHGPIPVVFDERTVISRDFIAGRSVIDKVTIHISDIFSEEGTDFPIGQELARDSSGVRSILCVPLLSEGESIGLILLRRTEVNPFTDKQIALLQTFADQAVIAIGNVRLFEEVQARTRDLTESLQQQTATSEVLEVISASAGDLGPVFQKMLANAIRVCGAEFGSMNLTEDGAMRPVAQYNVPAEYAAARGDRVFVPHPTSPLAKAIGTRQVVHWADLRTTESYLERYPRAVELVELAGARTVAIVPMLRDDEVIGAITIYRKEVLLFSDKQIELLSNFAKQAVIAIENARLLRELRQRTDDLTKSLEDLRAAQDRLVQTEKLASLGQLTAGIAHEIKNPLNFVNNFAAVSAELTDELKDALKPAELAEKIRAEVEELTGLLKDNLAKVVQHGKRADSIIKNMLLHSREGSGEHRPSDINALVDESLNLAYHGARAEKSDFNVTLERDFDTDAGEIDLFPQEITRVLLNMVSNGFYAVTKRRKESGEPGFEPTLRASTKNLGDSVEIRIRDNGTGIPSEVKEKMFNPFFTTKPAGEGTGLGLSMSHDIIVKQHGGTIDVDTEQGHFTEFRIVLPRTSNFAEKSRG